ncbi:uncharacterized protein L969DRAFT_105909 [Mixia osmundae IAM 14324]|uniref:Uncharacterized protein n=1 Tax=Mixia osmundae (strain CBS 9802 / IAM 14324 / JCM 22182 / KY 12970) TaxID=764103 RepID=G7DW90_MIXOS|nr:uncharacterized protein L969DRAFT_105909 [Mixia osmundae IAM 14324]KEI36523.1 hypothetical protein L969DRAFT_105909 [Mixia osmundae IAM 14324]GAA94778.1 hypothetical protein E5Q_01432 [Mixia osmundae IAM 14324]
MQSTLLVLSISLILSLTCYVPVISSHAIDEILANRIADTYTEFALFMTMDRAVRLCLADGQWSQPVTLFSKRIQRGTLVQTWDVLSIFHREAEYTFSFAVVQGLSTFVIKLQTADPFKILIDCEDRLSLDGHTGNERKALYEFQQCCAVLYEDSLSVRIVSNTIGKSSLPVGTESPLYSPS